ncbi:MAG TPA: hypothetical protein VKQ30_18735 [Ktedonobacterales bacterium]|nr:hypothetical protein [Ktedonobacterales bacterium]
MSAVRCHWGAEDTPIATTPGCDTEFARFSRHALRRAARRNVVPDAVEYVMTHGRVLHRTGITFYFLAGRDVPVEDAHAAWVTRLVGTVVLVAEDGTIITVYRNSRALPAIRRKLKYRIASCVPSCGMDGADDDDEDDDEGVRQTA